MSDYVDVLPVSPNSVLRPDTLGADADTFFGEAGLIKFRDQLNALPAIVGSAAQSGGFALAYIFNDATSGDPALGEILLNSGTQEAATALKLSPQDALGNDVSARIARVGVGTSDVKGELTVYRIADGRLWLSFVVTLGGFSSGNRLLTLDDGAGSEASPFTAGDAVLVTWTPAGDKGDTGLTAPFANVLAPYTASGSPSSVVFSPVPSGYGDLKFRFGLTFSTSAALRIALSEDGVNYTSAASITTSSASAAGEVHLTDIGGTMGMFDCAWSNSGSLFGAATRDATVVSNRNQGFWIAPGRITHIRFSLSTGTISSGGFDQPRAR